MQENNIDQIVYSKNVIEFVTVGNEFCNMIENHSAIGLKKFIETTQKMLPLLYLKASLLPLLDEETVDAPEKFVSEVDYNFLLNNLTEKFGGHDSYQEVFDANMQFSEAPIAASIAENICDIYQDIKDFVLNYRIGSPEIMADAIWECRNNFEQYWGQKLVNGLRAIHHLLFSGTSLDETINPKKKGADTKGKNWVNNHFTNFSDDIEDDEF